VVALRARRRSSGSLNPRARVDQGRPRLRDDGGDITASAGYSRDGDGHDPLGPPRAEGIKAMLRAYRRGAGRSAFGGRAGLPPAIDAVSSAPRPAGSDRRYRTATALAEDLGRLRRARRRGPVAAESTPERGARRPGDRGEARRIRLLEIVGPRRQPGASSNRGSRLRRRGRDQDLQESRRGRRPHASGERRILAPSARARASCRILASGHVGPRALRRHVRSSARHA